MDSQESEEEEHSIYVGNLYLETTEEDIVHFFSKCGEVYFYDYFHHIPSTFPPF